MDSGLFDFLQVEIDPDAMRAEAAATGILLFGAGGFARAVQRAVRNRGIPVHAHVISGEGPLTIEGVPVVRLVDLDPDWLSLPMWLAVFNRNADSDLSLLKDQCLVQGIGKVLMPQEYFEVIEPEMGWRFWLTDRRHYAENRRDIEAVYDGLADNESRQVFLDILRFRLGVSGARAPRPSSTNQYFPPEITAALAARSSRPSLVDGGAYDGDTLRLARQNCHPGQAYAFEPAPRNFERLVTHVVTLDFPVICVPCGLSSALESAPFAADDGEACAITQGGQDRILTVRLDQCLPTTDVDFLKLDVEGHEMSALEGARRVVESSRPLLALAAYHRWDDVWRLAEFLCRSYPDYRLSLLSHDTFDSVLYGIS